MNLNEAIKSLEARVEYGRQNYPSFSTADVQLGIEAMKRCELARKETSFVGPGPLPGETKD